MRIIIADDEYLARVTLRSTLEALDTPIDLIAEAEGGEEMIRLVRQIQPDAVFVDIRMPKLNGLEAIKAAREFSPQTQWYVLTGFPEFEYAQEAIRLGVSTYLLKPINPDELREIIQRIEVGCREQRASQNKQFERELMALTYGLQSLESDDASSISQRSQYTGAMLYLDSPLGEAGKADYQRQVCKQIRCLIDAHSGSGSRIALSVMPKGDLVTVGAWNTDPACAYGEQAATGYFEALASLAGEHRASEVALTLLSTPRCQSLGRLQAQIERLQALSALRVIAGTGQMITMQSLEKYGQDQQVGKASRVALHVCATYDEGNYLLYLKALDHFKKALDQTHRSLGRLAEFLSFVLQVDLPYEAPGEWIGVLREHGDLLLGASRDEAAPDLIAQVKAYIDENYAMNIGIGVIAEQMNITPNYLSSLFHKKTGTTFMNYLKQIRMQKAQELLLDSSLQIQQIAEQVGYYSARHFARLFAEQFGCLPSDYRETMRNRVRA